MDPAGQRLIDQIDAADGHAGIERACQAAELSGLSGKPGVAALRNGLAQATYRHLARRARHAHYLRWLDSYFGRRRETYRSPLQQPNYIYYPALAPVPWFSAHDHPGLGALPTDLPAVVQELTDWMSSSREFQPYVVPEAARDARWRALASSPAWSSLHLVRGGVRDESLLAALPRTRGFLDLAPLADYPPHAPECFVSRLMPGVVLPPHFGVSNIKLTVHLPVELPASGCSITVAGIKRFWMAGELLIFDDSFEHSAQNLSDASRTVLIFDVWHPGLDAEERGELAHAIRCLDSVQKVLDRLA